VLASGSGTILEAILAADIPVVVTVSDRPCRALEVAADANAAVKRLDGRSVEEVEALVYSELAGAR